MRNEQNDRQRFKVKNFDFKILTSISNGLYPSQIARQLKTSKQKIDYHIKKLQAIGLIEKIMRSCYCQYKITAHGRSCLSQNFSSSMKNFDFALQSPDLEEIKGCHNIYITLKILDKSKSKLPRNFWDQINDKLKNNIQHFKRTGLSFPITIRETTQKIVIQGNNIEVRSYDEILPMFWNVVYYVFNLFLRHDYVLDVKHPELKIGEYTLSDAFTRDLYKSEKEKGNKPKVKVMLGRSQQKVFKDDPEREAYAKFDPTPDPRGQRESNDLSHIKKAAMMPEILYDMNGRIEGVLEKLAQQIESHLALIQEYRQESVNNMEVMNKLVDKIGQPSKVYVEKPTEKINIERSDDLVHVELTDFVEEFEAEKDGITRDYPALNKGSRIWIPRRIADYLIFIRKAKAIG